MSADPNPTEARQGERGKSMLWVLLISLTVAAVLAIGAYIYVFAEDNEELDAPIPTAGDPATPATQ